MTGRDMIEGAQMREAGSGDGRATIVDVARAAGVSKSTVSLVISGSGLVAEVDARSASPDAMSELGYIYHRGAATLRGAKSGVLGMVINDLSNPFFVELAIGIEEACQGGAFIPFLANVAENPVRQLQVIRSMREHGAAGLLLSPAIGTSLAELKALVAGYAGRASHAPPSRASRPRLSGRKTRKGARKATAHLIAAGHRRIAFVGGVTSMIVREERLAGYRLALEEAGIPLDRSLVVETTITYSGGAAAAPQLLSLHQPATAALCFNDVVAIGLVRALRLDAASRSERTFGVIGFDDIEEARHTLPGADHRRVNGRSLGVARGAAADASARERRLRAGNDPLPDNPGRPGVLRRREPRPGGSPAMTISGGGWSARARSPPST